MDSSSPNPGLRSPARLRAHDVQLYRLCEDFSELLLYFAVVFSPWAFGTTQAWSIWTMNAVGYALGLMLLLKLSIRRKGYRPARWDERRPESDSGTRPSPGGGLIAALACLTAAILGYCLISALNARATFHLPDYTPEYHNCLAWLPHSLDSAASWKAFWSYLAMACTFWALRDWLLGKAPAEARPVSTLPGEREGGAPMPERLRRLLWVLAISGGLMAVEGIAQRLADSGKLLFLVQARVNRDADSQFGPYAYRSNAAQYFNLLWPVCLGFWWTLQRAGGFRRKGHHVLLLCGALMAACPLMSLSRLGAFTAIAMLLVGAFLLLATQFLFPGRRQEDRRSRRLTVGLLLLFYTVALAVGFAFGWKDLKPRLSQLSENYDLREEMYDNARPMAADYPVFGTGPGTFNSVFQLYRKSTETYWPAQLHNDWLETLITFGWTGSVLIGLALVLVLARWLWPGGLHGGRRFLLLTWLALAGCLVQARWDFPFQIYSIVLLFLAWCAMLTVLSRRPGG